MEEIFRCLGPFGGDAPPPQPGPAKGEHRIQRFLLDAPRECSAVSAVACFFLKPSLKVIITEQQERAVKAKTKEKK